MLDTRGKEVGKADSTLPSWHRQTRKKDGQAIILQ